MPRSTMPLVFAVLAIAFSLAACQKEPQTSPDSVKPESTTSLSAADIPLGQLPREVRPIAYQLELTIDPHLDEFKGRTTIDLDIVGSRDHFYLHGKNIEADKVQLSQGAETFDASYEQVDPSGVVRIDASRPIEGRLQLVIEYRAPFNQALEGLYKVSESGNDYAYTQFEAISARLAFPGFDEPGFKTPFTTTLTVPEDEVAISNTPVVSSATVDGMKVVHFAPTKPLPTYLIAFAVGDFDVVEWQDLPATEVRDHPLPLRGIAVKGKGDQLTYALENTNAIVTALESYFGTPYPWAKLDIIAVPDFSAGAMENVGAITYREPLLLFGDDATPESKRRYKLVHAHELAHQWFGDLVTPAWWNDIWLNESFATWMAHVAMDIAEPDGHYRRDLLARGLEVMSADSLVSARQIRQPIKSNDDIVTAFDGITYSKGGAVLSMFESFLGRDDFRRGVRSYMQDFEYKTATADDFIHHLAHASSDQPSWLVISSFNSFLNQPGLPLVEADSSCEQHNLGIHLKQSRYFPVGSSGKQDQQWQIPVCLRLGYAHDEIKTCLLLSEPEQSFELPQACPDWIVPNADSAGYYRFSLSPDGWKNLFAHGDRQNTNEMMSAAGSFSGAFNAGKVDVATLMSIVPQLVANPDWQVATAPIEQMNFMYENMATEGQKNELEERFAEYYSGKLSATGLENTNDIGRARLQDALVKFMANTARQPGLRASLVAMAKAYSGYGTDGQIHPEAANPIILNTALVVAVDELGPAFVDHLINLVWASTNAVIRGRALDAIGSTRDPDKAAEVRELVFSPKLRDNEIFNILYPQAFTPETRDATWSWFTKNIDRILQRIPQDRQGRLTFFGKTFCSMDKRNQVEAWFAPRIDDLTGGPRNLAQTLEDIDLCVAKVRLHKPELDAWLGQ